jgi:hypothetical protein
VVLQPGTAVATPVTSTSKAGQFMDKMTDTKAFEDAEKNLP